MNTHSTTTVGIDVGETVRAFCPGHKLLNRYKLDRLLGQGGMGVVWLARDEELERDVALKFLPAIFVNDRAGLVELKRETRRSLELTHPNIVRTYDFVQDSTIAGISMEYVDSDTLRNRRLDQPNGVFATAQIAPWVQQLCNALDYAHIQAAIVHRDLKPANLMVNGRDQLKVADFGISRSLVESMSTLTARHGVSGTLVYMSPQQLTGEPSTPSDDIYALGATLYELLTTRPPFYSGDVAAQVHGKTAPSLAERRQVLGIQGGEIPQNWESTIAECLGKDPAQRPHSAGLVAVKLGLASAAEITGRALERSSIASVPIGPVQPPALATGNSIATVRAPGVWAGRKKQIAVAGLGAVVLVASAGVFVAHQRAESERSRKAGELVIQQQIELKAALEKQRVAALRGGFKVRTEPPGAAVTVDGSAASATPADIKDLKMGVHGVEISLDGYEPIHRDVELVEEQPLDLGIVELKRTKGALKIASIPEDLTCKVLSKKSPLSDFTRKTPIEVSDLPTGEYVVTVTRPGWPDQTQTIIVEKGPAREMRFEFPAGRVSLTSVPTGAKVMVGKEEVGKTPYENNDLPPGSLTYTLSFAGYQDATVSGTITAEEAVFAKDVTLTKAASKAATAKASPTKTVRSSGSTARNRVSPSHHSEGSGSESAWDKAAKGMNLFRGFRGY